MKIVTFESTDADPKMRAMAAIMVTESRPGLNPGDPPRSVWARLPTAFYGPDIATVRERAQTFWDAEVAKAAAKASRPRKGKGEAAPEPEGVEASDVGDVI